MNIVLEFVMQSMVRRVFKTLLMQCNTVQPVLLQSYFNKQPTSNGFCDGHIRMVHCSQQ